MSGERVERRLAAILAADVAGYSRLMGEDEAGTLARLRTHRRDLIDPKVAEHKGRIVKTTGDGLLIEFPSVVEAVVCAIAVQQGMMERNAVAPADRLIGRKPPKPDLSALGVLQGEAETVMLGRLSPALRGPAATIPG